MRRVHAVLAISGVYATHSDWMQEEFDIATGYRKPVIGLLPWGSLRASSVVQDVAAAMVGWNTESIASAIRRHAI